MVIRELTTADQAFVTEMQYEALFVPAGAEPYPRSVLDDPDIARYHAAFGTRSRDAGVGAVDESGALLGAAWVRLVLDGYGSVDADTPELGIGVVAAHRGSGVGTALLGQLLVTAPRCSLSVDDRNPAVRLYERFGFGLVRRDGDHTLVMLRDDTA